MKILISYHQKTFSDIYVVTDYDDCDFYCHTLTELVENNYEIPSTSSRIFDRGEEDMFEVYEVNEGFFKYPIIGTSSHINQLKDIYIDYHDDSYEGEFYSGLSVEYINEILTIALSKEDELSANFITTFKEEAVKYYGEELVDVSIGNQIQILYPKVVIENSHGKKHTIYDLYVKLELVGNRIESITGMRGKLTHKEYQCQYLHSHLQRRSGFMYHRFCLGENTPISNIVGRPALRSYEDFLNFFAILDSYVSWESLEGGPYVKFSELGLYNRLTIRRSELKKNLGYFLKKYDKIPVNYDYNRKLLYVNMSQITPMIDKIATIYGRALPNGNFEQFGVSSSRSDVFYGTGVSFKGQNINIQVSDKFEENNTALPSYDNIVAHPTIKNFIIDNINSKLNDINYREISHNIAESLRIKRETQTISI